MYLIIFMLIFQQEPNPCTNHKTIVKMDMLQARLDSLLMRMDTVKIDTIR